MWRHGHGRAVASWTDRAAGKRQAQHSPKGESSLSPRRLCLSVCGDVRVDEDVELLPIEDVDLGILEAVNHFQRAGIDALGYVTGK